MPEGGALCLHENPTFDPIHLFSTPASSLLPYFLHVAYFASCPSSPFAILSSSIFPHVLYSRVPACQRVSSTVGRSNDTHLQTHSDSWWWACGEKEIHIPNWPSTVFRLVRTRDYVCVCVVVFFSFWVCVCLTSNDFLFKLVARLRLQTILPLPSVSPSFCSAAAPPSVAPAAIQLKRIPTRIQLKFLPNNQLNKQRQTACLQSASAGLSVCCGVL